MGSCISRPRWWRSNKPKPPLLQLPNELLLGVFLRLENVTVCRMRRTCSYLSSFVERNRLKIASRPLFGYRLGLVYYQSWKMTANPELRFALLDKNDARLGGRFSMRRNINERFSAISIRFLTIFGAQELPDEWRPFHFVEVRELINNLENKSISLRLVNVPCASAVEFLSSLDYPGLITLKISRYTHNVEELTTLQRAKNADRLWLDCRDIKIPEIYTKTQNFYGFLTITIQLFPDFIRDLYKSKGGNTKLAVFIDMNKTFVFRSYPPHQYLWRLYEVPRNLKKVPVKARSATPVSILKFELESKEKCAIVARYAGQYMKIEQGYKYRCNIFGVFVVQNNKKEILNCVMKNLGIERVNPRLREQFYDCSDEDAARIVRKMYLESDCYNIPLDCLMRPEEYV